MQNKSRNKLYWSVPLQTAPSCLFGQSRLGSGRIEIHPNVYKIRARGSVVDDSMNEDLPSHLTPMMLFFQQNKLQNLAMF